MKSFGVKWLLVLSLLGLCRSAVLNRGSRFLNNVSATYRRSAGQTTSSCSVRYETRHRPSVGSSQKYPPEPRSPGSFLACLRPLVLTARAPGDLQRLRHAQPPDTFGPPRLPHPNPGSPRENSSSWHSHCRSSCSSWACRSCRLYPHSV